MKREHWLLVMFAAWLVVGGCSGDTTEKDVPEPADVQVTDGAAEVSPEDVVPETSPELAAEDTATGPFPLPEITEPVPFRAGFAGGIMPVPLGTPTCGFAPGNKPKSPYTDTFPGSKYVYQHPTMRVAVLEGGMERQLIVRMDLIAVHTKLVERVAHDLTERTGYDWTGKVIMGASHTHSSTGRFGDGAIYGIMADTFFPQLFDRLVTGVVDLAVEAILAMEPARFGYGVLETDALHNDRRCQNPDVQDDRLHLLRFDREDGTPMGLIMVHSVHGTLFDPDHQMLSRDVVGGIEEKVKESFDSEVEVFFLQAGTGDMSPDDAEWDKEGDLPAIANEENRIEGLGLVAAGLVQTAFGDIETSAEIAVSTRSFYPPLSREVLGYEEGEFPFEGGGAYCGSTVDAPCWRGEPTPIPDLDKKCLDIKVLAAGMGVTDTAPDRTLLTAAMLGDVLIVTFPGEPVTQCLLNVETRLRAIHPEQETIIVLGYSQDYVGYSTPEWDFYQGGYEASGALWGPKQGDYITERAIEVGHTLLTGEKSVPFPDQGPYPLLQPEAAPFADTSCLVAGTVVTEPVASVQAGETVAFEFTGGSPWLLLPVVTLEQEVGYEFEIEVLPDPDDQTKPSSAVRTFTWRFALPTDRRVEAAVFPLSGTYRFRASGEYLPVGQSSVESYELTSAPFVVE